MKKRKEVESNTVIFFSFQYAYTCNLKYICEEALRRKEKWHIIWVVNDHNDVVCCYPNEVHLVKFGTFDYYKSILTSRILVANAFCFTKSFFSLKKGQTYLQTMHGSLGLKRIDSQAVKNEKRDIKARKDAALTTYIFSNSTFETEVYEKSFWRKETILEFGHARNDLFYWDKQKQAAVRKKVLEHFGLEKDCKLVLFAPTVRMIDERYDTELLDFQVVVDSLKQKYGGNWIALFRRHHSMEEGYFRLPHFVLNADDYADIQELMIAIDFGITDYSSWIYDYVLSRKPGILYVPDLEKYDQQRGFYYDISEVPFPVVKSNKELAESILLFDENAYNNKIDVFLERRGCIDDGNASSRIVDLMERIISANG